MTWLIAVCLAPHLWPMCMSHVTHIWHDVLCAIYSRRTHTDVCARDVTHRYVPCALCVCVARRVHVWRASCMRVIICAIESRYKHADMCECDVTHCYVSCAVFVTQTHTNIHQHTTWPILMRCDWLISTRCDRILRHAIINQTHTHTHTYTEYREGVWSARRVPHINTYEWCTHTNTYTHTQAHTFIHLSEAWSTLGTHTAYQRVCDRISISQDYHVSHVKASCPTYEWATSHKYCC